MGHEIEVSVGLGDDLVGKKQKIRGILATFLWVILLSYVSRLQKSGDHHPRCRKAL